MFDAPGWPQIVLHESEQDQEPVASTDSIRKEAATLGSQGQPFLSKCVRLTGSQVPSGNRRMSTTAARDGPRIQCQTQSLIEHYSQQLQKTFFSNACGISPILTICWTIKPVSINIQESKTYRVYTFWPQQYQIRNQ